MGPGRSLTENADLLVARRLLFPCLCCLRRIPFLVPLLLFLSQLLLAFLRLLLSRGLVLLNGVGVLPGFASFLLVGSLELATEILSSVINTKE